MKKSEIKKAVTLEIAIRGYLRDEGRAARGKMDAITREGFSHA